MVQRKSEMLLFRWLNPHHFIMIMAMLIALACISGYGISVGMGKVDAFFPYISETGTTPPASCVFGLLLNMAAMFAFFTMYTRHGHMEHNNLLEHRKIHIVNDVALFIGFLSCFGMMLVACFQCTKVIVVHMIGAFMVFGLGIVYCYLQSYLSYKTIGRMCTNYKVVIRFIISMVATLAFIFTAVFAGVASWQSKEDYKFKDKLHWNSGEPGYQAHLVSAFSEWIMAICFVSFFLTFYQEFRNVESKVKIQNKLEDFLHDMVSDQEIIT